MANLIVRLEVTQDHFRRGDLKSCMLDPIGLALKESLDLHAPKDSYAVGEDEIFLARGKYSFVCEFDVKGYYLNPSRSEAITLTFVPV